MNPKTEMLLERLWEFQISLSDDVRNILTLSAFTMLAYLNFMFPLAVSLILLGMAAIKIFSLLKITGGELYGKYKKP